MKRTTLLTALVVTLAVVLPAQQVSDDFGSIRGWTAGAGDWAVRGGRLIQLDSAEPLARADRQVRQNRPYELEFTVRYIEGGYRDADDLADGVFHAGFGIHIGVENPALRGRSWGAGESYLLWLNLDTRPDTRRNHPQHYGFRAQVYRSDSNTSMALLRDPSLRRDPELGNYVVEDYMSIDIIEALRAWGVDFSIQDIGRFLNRDVTINVRVDPRSGRVGVLDPTAPVRFYFSVDPEILRGDYLSLRSNGLALSYDYFTVN